MAREVKRNHSLARRARPDSLLGVWAAEGSKNDHPKFDLSEWHRIDYFEPTKGSETPEIATLCGTCLLPPRLLADFTKARRFGRKLFTKAFHAFNGGRVGDIEPRAITLIGSGKARFSRLKSRCLVRPIPDVEITRCGQVRKLTNAANVVAVQADLASDDICHVPSSR